MGVTQSLQQRNEPQNKPPRPAIFKPVLATENELTQIDTTIQTAVQTSMLNDIEIPQEPLSWKVSDDASLQYLHHVWTSDWFQSSTSSSICQNNIPSPELHTDNNDDDILPHAQQDSIITFACKICLDDEVRIDEAFPIPLCGHTFCRTCARELILSHIQSLDVPIGCPLCRMELAEIAERRDEGVIEEPVERGAGIKGIGRRIQQRIREILVQRFWKRDEAEGDNEIGDDGWNQVPEIDFAIAATVLTEPEMVQFERVLFLKAVNTDHNFQHCPNPKCEGIVYNDDPDVTTMRCTTCDTNVCWKCKTETAHEGMTCERYQQLNRMNGGSREHMQFEELVVNKKWKRCPKCGVVTHKEEGCNKMACELCKAFWCFVCGKTLSKKRPYLHFTKRWSKCYNKLFQD